MKHPNQEQWMEYLYNELSAGERSQFSAHLATCEECRRKVRSWQQTMTSLDEWQPPVSVAPAVRWSRTVRWAAAAMLMLGLGFALSRMTTPVIDQAALRAELKSEVESGVQKQWQQELKKLNAQIDRQRLEDQQQVVQTLRQMEAQRLADFASLRYELDTLAMSADNRKSDGFSHATAQVKLDVQR